MRRARVTAVLGASLLLALLPSTGVGSGGVDAASDDPWGTDAPDWRGGAWRLNWTETYQGGVDGSDMDWYFVRNVSSEGLAVTLDGSVAWDLSLRVVDGNGTLLGVGGDGTHRILTDTGLLYLGISADQASTWELSVTNVSVAPQDETGGSDAPPWPGRAVDAGGTSPLFGVLEPPFIDDADWFRLAVPDGHYLAVNATAVPESYVGVQVRETDGTILAWWGLPTSRVWTEIDHQGQELLLGLVNPREPLDWDVGLDHRPRPDVAVTDVAVADPAAGPTEVTVTVANQGLGESRDGWLKVWATHPTHQADGPTRILDRPVQLGPGTNRTFTGTWDTMGAVGEATIHARVTSAFDNVADNDTATVTTHVLAPVPGLGVDLWPPR